MNKIFQGLNGFQLKVLALIFMTFDHISAFLWGVLDVPIWFNWIGRLSAPIFIFMVAEGFYHTGNRKKYVGRLYVWSIVMGIGNNLMNRIFPHPEGMIIINNIFATMFLITIFLTAIELCRSGKKAWGIGLAFVPMFLTGLFMVVMGSGNLLVLKIFMLAIPTILSVEGGIILIALGIGCYLFRISKKKFSIFYVLISAFNFVIVVSAGFTMENLLLLNYQWLMIFALPIMLMYNGEKGRGMKHFFYLYYPLHCYFLYWLGVVLSN